MQTIQPRDLPALNAFWKKLLLKSNVTLKIKITIKSAKLAGNLYNKVCTRAAKATKRSFLCEESFLL